MSKEHDTRHIFQSLASNIALAAAKFAAAFYTGSGALLAEAIHTTADSSNQILLLIGVSRARKPPDRRHPLGYGRELYFWSFQVALLLFSAGGVFSIYEGVHKFSTPEPITNAWVGFAILAFTLIMEIVVTAANFRQINSLRGDKGFYLFVQESKESDLIVVFGENLAALLGTVFACLAYTLSYLRNDGRYDAIGSIMVGLVLVGVAVFLAIEVKSLLIGESADAEIYAAAESLAFEDPNIDAVAELIVLQQGPGEVLVALKLRCPPTLHAYELSKTINAYEARLRAKCPQARWIFVEPDLQEGAPSVRLE